jgi:hypothetical protein
VEEFLAKFNAGELIGLVAVAGGLLVGLVAVVMGCWENIRRAELTATLKRDMLNRGMSADEIRTVMDAGTKAARKERHGHNA